MTSTKRPLRIEVDYCFNGYVVKLYRGYSIQASLETGIAEGPETQETLRKALKDLHKRWNMR